MEKKQANYGIGFALSAYLIWGLTPIYFRLIEQVPPMEIMMHRIIWSALFLLVSISVRCKWHQVFQIFSHPKKMISLTFTALTIGSNWLLFIWSVNSHHILEASLGYFITPIFSIILGIVFLNERFRCLQWLAIGMTILGIIIRLWWFKSVPIISIGLALTFSIYALGRKKIQVDAQSGTFIETALLFPIAVVYMLGFADTSTSMLSNNPITLNLELMGTGVTTTVPLILFAEACKRLRLSTIGFFQYLGPTIIFLIAVLLYDETVSFDTIFTFGIIWCALGVFLIDSILFNKKSSG